MLEKKYTNIIYLIGFTIVVTIALQFYWNYKIYHINKQQLINQIQVSFDKSVEDYYNHLAKENVLTFIDSDSIPQDSQTSVAVNNKNLKNQIWVDGKQDSNHSKNIIKIRSNTSKIDTLNIQDFNINDVKHISVFKGEIDTLKLKNLTTKIMFSFQEQKIDLIKLDSLLNNDLKKKNIDIPYQLIFEHKNLETDSTEVIKHNSIQISNKTLTSSAISSFLPHQSKLKITYNTSTFLVLSTMIGSILLSLLLVVFIVGCLLFLLKIIFKQKQLSLVKNDLINNITHEFKTPIATISVALEGLQNFDAIKDESKRDQYLSMSNEQLQKLNEMVEKLLETATLKTDRLMVNLELVNLSNLIKNIVSKYEFCDPEKSVSLFVQDNIKINLDRFLIENALNNIIDNAIKYGGNEIKISTNQQKEFVEINIQDNGGGIDQKYKNKIFDQFYRVPTGDIHNIKGFGIGLYYTKKIIEKHQGKVVLSENKKGKVIFKIRIPYDN